MTKCSRCEKRKRRYVYMYETLIYELKNMLIKFCYIK